MRLGISGLGNILQVGIQLYAANCAIQMDGFVQVFRIMGRVIRRKAEKLAITEEGEVVYCKKDGKKV